MCQPKAAKILRTPIRILGVQKISKNPEKPPSILGLLKIPGSDYSEWERRIEHAHAKNVCEWCSPWHVNTCNSTRTCTMMACYRAAQIAERLTASLCLPRAARHRHQRRVRSPEELFRIKGKGVHLSMTSDPDSSGDRKREKLPHGRRLAGGEVVNGRWVATEQTMRIRARRVTKHRIDCLERCRRMRDELVAQVPELR